MQLPYTAGGIAGASNSGEKYIVGKEELIESPPFNAVSFLGLTFHAE